MSLLLLGILGCQNHKEGSTPTKWIKPDTICADLSSALVISELCAVLVLRNTLPSGKAVSTPKVLDERVAQLKNLKVLSIYGVRQKEIPKEILELRQLEKLEIRGYGTVKSPLRLPPDLSLLTSLKTLVISQCMIEKIPHLPTGLLYLDVSDNQIVDVPEELLNSGIKVFDFSKNHLKEIDLPETSAATKLDLSDNRIQHCRGSMEHWQHLAFLSLSNNPIVEVPSGINVPNIEVIGQTSFPHQTFIGDKTKRIWMTVPVSGNLDSLKSSYPSVEFMFFEAPKP